MMSLSARLARRCVAVRFALVKPIASTNLAREISHGFVAARSCHGENELVSDTDLLRRCEEIDRTQLPETLQICLRMMQDRPNSSREYEAVVRCACMLLRRFEGGIDTVSQQKLCQLFRDRLKELPDNSTGCSEAVCVLHASRCFSIDLYESVLDIFLENFLRSLGQFNQKDVHYLLSILFSQCLVSERSRVVAENLIPACLEYTNDVQLQAFVLALGAKLRLPEVQSCWKCLMQAPVQDMNRKTVEWMAVAADHYRHTALKQQVILALKLHSSVLSPFVVTSALSFLAKTRGLNKECLLLVEDGLKSQDAVWQIQDFTPRALRQFIQSLSHASHGVVRSRVVFSALERMVGRVSKLPSPDAALIAEAVLRMDLGWSKTERICEELTAQACRQHYALGSHGLSALLSVLFRLKEKLPASQDLHSSLLNFFCDESEVLSTYLEKATAMEAEMIASRMVRMNLCLLPLIERCCDLLPTWMVKNRRNGNLVVEVHQLLAMSRLQSPKLRTLWSLQKEANLLWHHKLHLIWCAAALKQAPLRELFEYAMREKLLRNNGEKCAQWDARAAQELLWLFTSRSPVSKGLRRELNGPNRLNRLEVNTSLEALEKFRELIGRDQIELNFKLVDGLTLPSVVVLKQGRDGNATFLPTSQYSKRLLHVKSLLTSGITPCVVVPVVERGLVVGDTLGRGTVLYHPRVHGDFSVLEHVLERRGFQLFLFPASDFLSSPSTVLTYLSGSVFASNRRDGY